MATIADGKFKMRVTPQYKSYWIFNFEFFYNDKSLFNPEITRGGIFKADEEERHPLLPVLEKAVGCTVKEETFHWGAWECEVTIEIRFVANDPNKILDNDICELEIWIDEQRFVDGEIQYFFQNAGVQLFSSRKDLKNFYQELKAEMQDISSKKKNRPPVQ